MAATFLVAAAVSLICVASAAAQAPNPPPAPTITFKALNTFPNQNPQKPFVGEQVEFTASASTDPAATYEWDFNGDGQYEAAASAPSIITVLTTPGDIIVRVKVAGVPGSIPIHVDRPPVASFAWSPPAPQTGQTVQFTSTAVDPDGPSDILYQHWDLNGDGNFSDARGPSQVATFLTAGNHKVSLRIADRTHVVSTATQTITVTGAPASPPPPPPGGGPTPVIVPGPSQPSSFASSGGAVSDSSGGPVSDSAASRTLRVIAGVRVSIAGSVAWAGTRVKRLLVVAPRGALVRAVCAGKGCPAKRERHRAGKRAVRLRKFERTFKGPAKVAVQVTKSGFIGKDTLFTFRRGKAPVRRELCLPPGARAAAKCPTA